MFVKKFEAPSLEQALTMVKGEMGPNALILSTQNRRSGLLQKPMVEVTAAYERKSERRERPEYDDAMLATIFPHRRAPAYSAALADFNADEDLPVEENTKRSSPRMRSGAGNSSKNNSETTSKNLPDKNPIEEELLRNGFSADSAKTMGNRMFFEFRKRDLDDPKLGEKIRTKVIAEGLKTLTFDYFLSQGRWNLLGMSGSGKTTLAVKLAMAAKRVGTRVTLVGADKRKLLGQKELSQYAKIIDVDFVGTGKPGVKKRPNHGMANGGDGLCLVDTAAFSFGNEEDWEEVEGKSVVVIDALTRFVEQKKFIERLMKRVELEGVAFTRFDGLSQTGPLYDLLRALRLPVLGASLSPSFKTPFQFFDCNSLAAFIVKGRQI